MDLEKRGIFSGNMLKIIAAISMSVDHIGVELFPQYDILRIIGRIAFPIFAYMLAEGCKYTKNRGRHLGLLVLLAALCQAVFTYTTQSYYQSILVTFSLSVCMIYSMEYALSKRTVLSSILPVVVMGSVFVLTDVLPLVFKDTDYAIDYGFVGVMIPVLVYMGQDKMQKLLYAAIGLTLMSLSFGEYQWVCLMSLPLLALYNGKRGKLRMKYFFYIYYPAHLVAIYLISNFV